MPVTQNIYTEQHGGGRLVYSCDVPDHIASVHRLKYTVQKAVAEFACLDEAYLCQADLSDLNLSAAKMRCADLTYSNLSGSNLNNARLAGSHLFKADLTSVVAVAADFNECNLRTADLRSGDYRYSMFRKSNFSGADLRHSDFSFADVPDSFFDQANLDHAKFLNAKLNGCDLSQIQQSNLVFDLRMIIDDLFKNEDIIELIRGMCEGTIDSSVKNINENKQSSFGLCGRVVDKDKYKGGERRDFYYLNYSDRLSEHFFRNVALGDTPKTNPFLALLHQHVFMIGASRGMNIDDLYQAASPQESMTP